MQHLLLGQHLGNYASFLSWARWYFTSEQLLTHYKSHFHPSFECCSHWGWCSKNNNETAQCCTENSILHSKKYCSNISTAVSFSHACSSSFKTLLYVLFWPLLRRQIRPDTMATMSHHTTKNTKSHNIHTVQNWLLCKLIYPHTSNFWPFQLSYFLITTIPSS